MLSPLEKLNKFLELEREQNYENRAVVGGLDKAVPYWEKEARAFQLPDDLISFVVEKLQEYPRLTPEQRRECVHQIYAQIESCNASTKPMVAETEPTPAQSRGVKLSERASIATDAPVETEQHILRTLQTPLHRVSGVGKKTAEALEKLGINTLQDLLYFFPRRYDDYSRLKPINKLKYGDEVTVLGVVQAIASRQVRDGKLQLIEAIITDGTGTLRLSWFNKLWYVNRFPKGTQVAVSGKLDMYLGKLIMKDPEIEEIDREQLHTSRIVPVYPLTADLNQKSLRRLMYRTIMQWAPKVSDFLPASVRSSLKLLELGVALSQAHFPDSQDVLDQARWRLAFDEIFLLQLGVLRQKHSWKSLQARVFDVPDTWLEQKLAQLPYELTNAQKRAVQEIRADLVSGKPMDRLLQGDVGSGKTIVAALAIGMVTYHGAQVAVMAPTSILAEQHYRNLSRVLTQSDESTLPILQPEQIRLLTSDVRGAEREKILNDLQHGSVKLLIGTHALIEDPVQFQDLQLVVIDEQHRFGVAQRAALRQKGNNPHLLVMTATPIPRSLALTIYGDLDLTVMDEMPPGRQPVETHVLHPLERERAYQLIRHEISKGHQAYIIYPMVEQNENGEHLSVVQEYTRLQQEIFPEFRIGMMHGKLKPEEKDEVMAGFRDGKYHILVSTSVIEVGVDVPNATVMLIEGANRFGLAQLHQFRGRVGRGSEKSYCLLIPESDDALENERLSVMVETNDGFVLAEKDLQQRGPGEFLGTRQAGFSELKMANLTDVHIIEKARQQAQLIFQQDPELSLPEHTLLAKKLGEFWRNGRGDIS
ncbi:ATP-dependent DNA helicase RecG [Anaerolinea thermophila]|uniref:ATP-dependent DNA helicase RecG n=1 Tax=Anaerolinea thermophila (strain DSM 14523 / JCM 11388 / NBRC 100420 / UNI-1) TaxID=926569 RepID=E8N541_ANATU|nr:ATP-dependent DNA helicase RecG [Anaerolinea thermophila]BAJ63555.1 ATP-dependent DNA helicase RecG [Anaerolinea thermophila UNI-1]